MFYMKMQKKTLKLIIFLNLLTFLNGNSHHSIMKRALLFPRASVLQFTYGLSVPLILPSRSINFSSCLQVNYDLPFNLTNFQTRVIQAKSAQSYNFDLTRTLFYKYMIRFIDGLGLDGEHCLLRLICEIAKYPMYLEQKENLLEEITHYVFTPSLDLVENSTDIFTKKLLEAEQLGQKNGKCNKIYSSCIVSFAGLFTAKYLI